MAGSVVPTEAGPAETGAVTPSSAAETPTTEGDTETTEGDAEATAGEAETSPVATEQSNEGLDTEATFRFAYNVGPTSFDPSKASSSFDNVALFLTYDRLVHLTPEGEGIPGLAESWEFADDGSTLTMHLREGVKFQDGSDFTAEVAKANLDRNKAGTSIGDLAAIDSVDVVDPLTIQLNCGDPCGHIPLVLSDRAGAMASQAGIDDPNLDLNPVGAGMYKVVEYQTDALIKYERWDGYWDPGAVGAAKFELVILQDTVSAFNAIQSGQVNSGLILPNQIEDAERANLVVTAGLSNAVYFLQLDRSKPFLDDKNVRRAMSMAINREALLESIGLGQGEVSVQPFPANYWAANDDIPADYIPYDPEGAKKLLEEAGVPEGQSYDVIVPTTGVYPQLAEAVQAMFDDVGITLNLVSTDSASVAPVFYTQRQGDMLLAVWGGRPDPAQTLLLQFTEGPLQNPGGHSTPRLEELALEVTQPGTIEERAPAIHEMVKEVVDEQMNLVLFDPFLQFASGENVRGFKIYSSAKPEFRGVGLAQE